MRYKMCQMQMQFLPKQTKWDTHPAADPPVARRTGRSGGWSAAMPSISKTVASRALLRANEAPLCSGASACREVAERAEALEELSALGLLPVGRPPSSPPRVQLLEVILCLIALSPAAYSDTPQHELTSYTCYAQHKGRRDYRSDRA